jgi:hypothetical protein
MPQQSLSGAFSMPGIFQQISFVVTHLAAACGVDDFFKLGPTVQILLDKSE